MPCSMLGSVAMSGQFSAKSHSSLKASLLATVALAMTASPAVASESGDKQAAEKPDLTIVVEGETSNSPFDLSQMDPPPADLGPLGKIDVMNAPYSIQVVPQDVMLNAQVRSISDLFKYMPTAQIEARGGIDVGRPQTRGFEGSVVDNSRISGLNAVSTTSYPTELFDRVEVVSGLSGAIFGPASPAGTFNYVLKRPTDKQLLRYTQSFDSDGIFTEHADVGGHVGKEGWLGYRLNVLHGQGDGYVSGSSLNRDLFAGDFDVKVTPTTMIEADVSWYSYEMYGYPGGFGYGSGNSTELPKAPDVTKRGYGQSYGGLNNDTFIARGRLKQKITGTWNFSAGFLHEMAYRQGTSPSNTFTDNEGDYTTKMSVGATRSAFQVDSNNAYVTGTVSFLGMDHDLNFGTNGYRWANLSQENKSTSVTLGSASLANPVVYPKPDLGSNGKVNQVGNITKNQSIIIGDTVHVNDQWTVMVVASDNWLSTHNKTSGSRYKANGKWSPSASLMFKPAANMMLYATYADVLQSGDSAPEGADNYGDVLAPYRSREYEIGYKVTVGGVNISTAGFRINRPFAFTDPDDNVFKILGDQVNWGAELLVNGHVTGNFSLFGGVSVLKPKLKDTGDDTTSDKDVVGVPKLQFSVMGEYKVPAVEGLVLNTNVHYTGRRAANTTNTTWVDGYATWDLGFRYSNRTLLPFPATFRFQVLNVTGTRYWASVFPGSINGSSSATYTAFAGAPRTVQMSVAVDF